MTYRLAVVIYRWRAGLDSGLIEIEVRADVTPAPSRAPHEAEEGPDIDIDEAVDLETEAPVELTGSEEEEARKLLADALEDVA
jgi:hypothetical protein